MVPTLNLVDNEACVTRNIGDTETWGHSMIINPWGEIEQVIATGEGYVSVDYQPDELTRIRQSMPLNSPLKQSL